MIRKRLLGATVAGLALVGASTGAGVAVASAQSTPKHTTHSVKTVAATTSKPATRTARPAVMTVPAAAVTSSGSKATTKPPSSSTHSCPNMGSGSHSGSSSKSSSGSSATAAALS